MIECLDKEFIIDYLIKEDEIANQNIVAVINNVKESLFGDSEDDLKIFVDHLQEPTYVMVREHTYWHYVYAKSDKAIRTLQVDYFDEQEEFGMSAVDMRVYEIFCEKRKMNWSEPCELMYFDKNNFLPYKNKYELTKCTLDQAEEINEFYTFKDEFSLEFIKDDIRNRPSVIYKDNGLAASWLLVHRDDSIGIMYTKEAYRKKGLAYELSMYLLNDMLKLSKIPCIHIGIKNDVSFALAKKCGFKYYKKIIWFGI